VWLRFAPGLPDAAVLTRSPHQLPVLRHPNAPVAVMMNVETAGPTGPGNEGIPWRLSRRPGLVPRSGRPVEEAAHRLPHGRVAEQIDMMDPAQPAA
jgi:hypothetical protein